MTDKEFKKMKKEQLLGIMLEQAKRIEQLEEELKKKDEELNSRTIMLEEAGTIAEASLRINKVLQTVQQAADQYLENVMLLNKRAEEKAKNNPKEE